MSSWARRVLVLAVLTACASDPDENWVESAINLDDFLLPELSAAERASIVHDYDRLDPTDLIPRGLLEDAILYYDVNKPEIPKTRYFVVVDQSKYSGKDRFWLVDTMTGAVEKHKVAHGDGSDPNNDGYATVFGNGSGSHMSSLGFYLTGEIYDGTHPHSMRLDGLSRDGSPNGMANTNARSRLIVVHEASYVSDTNTSQQGRSNGCLALDPNIERGVVDKIFGGSLIYAARLQLNAPVGRTACGDSLCTGTEDATSCAADCAGEPDPDVPGDDPNVPGEDVPDEPEPGGCNAGGGSGLLFALLLAMSAGTVSFRSRSRRSSRRDCPSGS